MKYLTTEEKCKLAFEQGAMAFKISAYQKLTHLSLQHKRSPKMDNSHLTETHIRHALEDASRIIFDLPIPEYLTNV